VPERRRPRRVRRLAAFGGVRLSQAGRVFVLVALIDSVGTGLYLASSVLFLTRAVGLTGSQVGLGVAAGAVTGFLATVPAGMLADRRGAKGVLMMMQAWRGLCFIALALIGSFTQFLVVSILLGLADRGVGPVTQAVVGAAVEDTSRVRVLALMRSVRNAGFGAGAAISTALIAVDNPTLYRGMVLADAASFFIAVAVLAKVNVANRPTIRTRSLFGGPRVFLDRPYLALSGLNGVLTLHMTLLAVGIPLWTATRTDAPLWVVGVVLVLNTVLSVLLQVWAARGCEDVRTAVRRGVWAGVALAGCAVMLPLAADRPAAVAAAVVLLAALLLTLGELWQSASAWGLSNDLAPAQHRGEYLSAFSLGRSLQEAAGPVVITALVIPYPGLGWPLVAVVFVLAGLGLPPVSRSLMRRLSAAPAPGPA
jgi:MFS family permease